MSRFCNGISFFKQKNEVDCHLSAKHAMEDQGEIFKNTEVTYIFYWVFTFVNMFIFFIFMDIAENKSILTLEMMYQTEWMTLWKYGNDVIR
jgi:hypothetical protein